VLKAGTLRIRNFQLCGLTLLGTRECHSALCRGRFFEFESTERTDVFSLLKTFARSLERVNGLKKLDAYTTALSN
jgi:hypothetical protein